MKYLGTAIGSALMLLFTLPAHGGFLLFFFLVFLVPLFLYSGVRMYRYQHELNTRAKKLAIWMSAILVALAVNVYRYTSTRDAADDVVSKIVQYHETNGTYPSSLETLGYESKSLKANLGMYGYSNKDGTPSFFYAVPYIVFDSYHYDFHSGEWINFD